MKYELPSSHGLPHEIVSNPELVPRTAEGDPSLTDVQFAALEAGVARGASLLVVAPTSTGKTLIGIWALASWLKSDPRHHAVYLVTHRALAAQKFEELDALLRPSCFQGDGSCIVLADGDSIRDGNGNTPIEPLNVPVLVATYEKYLAMLAGSGIREDMSHCAVVCDEIQIIGDQHRGKQIEVLMTILRMARWGQVVGLSAVLEASDAEALSSWLDVRLIRSTQREKHLRYECRRPDRVQLFETTRDNGDITEEARGRERSIDTIGIVRELLAEGDCLPVVVFCMTKNKVFELAQEFAESKGVTVGPRVSIHEELADATTSALELTSYLQHRFAYHSADLLQAERALVEKSIKAGDVDVVFSTSTLAAGVNFPFRTAVFDSWKRYNQRTQIHEPIPASDFQNMAGRVGRMGFEGDYGRVLFTAENGFRERAANVYLSPDLVSQLELRLRPEAFTHLALQLASSGICKTKAEVESFLTGTLSAERERARNRAGLAHWQQAVSSSIDELKAWGFLL
ncbi:DEAD/DEAH box helicase [Methylocystis echinoides]|uniref:DEAD/DEAH box helicase n=1 Tax=Methylocystis echinoides TaxID=29468 RepID=UPI00344633F2